MNFDPQPDAPISTNPHPISSLMTTPMSIPETLGGFKRYPMPFTRMEVAVLTLMAGDIHVLLALRSTEPHAGQWALPGGVLRTDLDLSLDAAAHRVIQERAGLTLPFLKQMCAVGGPDRDPRSSWAVSLVYRAVVDADDIRPVAGKRTDRLSWVPFNDIVKSSGLAFDHQHLITLAVQSTRDEVERLEIPPGLLPAQFTLGELQVVCEQFLHRRLDKSSLRRKLADRGLVEPVEGAWKPGPNRPAQIYRWASGLDSRRAGACTT